VAAAFAQGRTTVSDAQELRHKETDRIAKICQELRNLGAELQEAPDGFTIQGGKSLSGGETQAHGDHRLAMAMTVAGLAAQGPVTVEGAEIIAESYPGFTDTLESLGADLRHE
jgi:3-phosphoshikimate 1-carboxyvinyltransferase